MSLFENRVQRTLQSIHMEKVDKIPFSYSGPAYLAKRQGVTLAEFLGNYEKATDASIAFCKSHPGIDSIHSPIMATSLLKNLWLSDVWIPGKELPENELWQIREYERIDLDDYRKIVKNGYGPWLAEYMQKLGDTSADALKFIEATQTTIPRMMQDAQVMVLNSCGSVGGPIEGFCGARTLINFFIDIMDEPDLVKAALDEAFKFIYKDFINQLDAIPKSLRAVGGAWIGGWRAAPNMLSHDQFMEYCWPYLEKLILATIERGVIPVLHFDSNWESELETIHTLPPRSCILMLDGTTDPRKVRKVLGDDMCIMGDVPSRMLVYSTPNEIYNYVTKLIDDVGFDTGLIVSSGCDCPFNANDENVDAMIQATLDYHC